MKTIIAKAFALVVFLNIFPTYLAPANATSATIYESLTGTNNTNINSSGSSDSVGFTGTGQWLILIRIHPWMALPGFTAILTIPFLSFQRIPGLRSSK
jgi:hypothetical protein